MTTMRRLAATVKDATHAALSRTTRPRSVEELHGERRGRDGSR